MPIPTITTLHRTPLSSTPLVGNRGPTRVAPSAPAPVVAHGARRSRGRSDAFEPSRARFLGALGESTPLSARALHARAGRSPLAMFALQSEGGPVPDAAEDPFAAIERAVRLRDVLEDAPAADSDAISELLAYYPTLDLARRVAEEMPSLRAACAEFLSGTTLPAPARASVVDRVLPGVLRAAPSSAPATVSSDTDAPYGSSAAPLRLRLPDALARVEPPSAPLGNAAFGSRTELKTMVESRDPRLGLLCDDALRELARTYSAIDLITKGPDQSANSHDASSMQQGNVALFKLLDRALHLKLPGFTDLAGFFAHEAVMKRLPWHNSDQLGGAQQSMATMARRAQVQAARGDAVTAFDPSTMVPPGWSAPLANDSLFSPRDRALGGSTVEIGDILHVQVPEWSGRGVAMAADELRERFAAHDPAVFDVDVNSLRALCGTPGLGDVGALLDAYGDPRVLKVVSQLVRSNGHESEPGKAAREFLSKPIPARWVTPEAVPMIAELRTAVGVPFRRVQLEVPGGTVRLTAHPSLPLFRRRVEERKAGAEVVEEILKSSGDERLLALYRLANISHPAGKQAPNNRVGHMLADGVTLRRRGFEPLSGSTVGPPAYPGAPLRERLMWMLNHVDHPAGAAVLAGLYLSDPKSMLDPYFRSKPDFAPHAARWTELAQRIALLDADGVGFVFSELCTDPDFEVIALRLELRSRLERHPSEAEIESIVREASLRSYAERRATIRALGAAAAQASTPDDVASEIRAALRKELAEDTHPEATEVRELLAASRCATTSSPASPVSLSDRLEGVTATMKAEIEAGTKPDLAPLLEVLTAAPLLADAQLVRALDELHQADRTRVVPLEKVDDLAATYRAELWPTKDLAAVTRTADTVTLLGVELPRGRWAHLDQSAIPEVKAPVWTPSLKTWFAKLARADRDGQPRRLEGPPGTNKTSAVQFLAMSKGQPLVILNMSPSTDETDLVGGPVRGDVEHDAEALVAMTQEKRDALYDHYGVTRDEKPDPLEVQVRRLIAAQVKIRFQLSELLKAMETGASAFIDEYNLCPPAILENFVNPVLDGRKFVVDKNRGQVIERHPDFRIYAAGNPAASTVGRAQTSSAARSRIPPIFVPSLTREDAEMILAAEFGSKLSKADRKKLAGAHDALAKLAESGELGGPGEEIAFTPRDLLKVGKRFEEYRGNPKNGLSDADLLRREVQSIYLNGLVDAEDRKKVLDVLKLHVPYSGVDFYANIELTEDEKNVYILDVEAPKVGSPRAPGSGERLTPTKRSLIALYETLKAKKNRENVLLTGSKSSGKTTIAVAAGAYCEQEVFEITGAPDSDEYDLIGARDQSGFVPRAAVRAAGYNPAHPEDKRGGILVFNEVNLPRSAETEKFNSLLDHRRELVLTKDKGRRVKAPEEFFFIGTMNPAQFGDEEYGGRRPLSGPLFNRFTKIYVPPLEDKEELKEILRAAAPGLGLPLGAADMLVELQDAVVSGYAEGRYGADEDPASLPVFSYRSLRKAAESLANMMKAAKTVKERDEAVGTVIRDFLSETREPKDRDQIEADLVSLALRHRRSLVTEKPAEETAEETAAKPAR